MNVLIQQWEMLQWTLGTWWQQKLPYSMSGHWFHLAQCCQYWVLWLFKVSGRNFSGLLGDLEIKTRVQFLYTKHVLYLPLSYCPFWRGLCLLGSINSRLSDYDTDALMSSSHVTHNFYTMVPFCLGCFSDVSIITFCFSFPTFIMLCCSLSLSHPPPAFDSLILFHIPAYSCPLLLIFSPPPQCSSWPSPTAQSMWVKPMVLSACFDDTSWIHIPYQEF